MVCSRILLASIALAAALQAQGTTATLADGRILTPLSPPVEFLTEGPITALDTASKIISAQGLNVTVPATIDGLPFKLIGTNFAGAEITAATFNALLDENAAAGGRDAGGPLHPGAVRSIFSSGKIQIEATQDSPASLAMRAQLHAIRSTVEASHAVVLLPTEGIAFPGQSDNPPPDTFQYSGSTLKSAGQVYQDAAGNRFLIPDGDAVVEFAENLVMGPITSVNATGAFPSFVMGEMPVVLNPDPRLPTVITGLSGVEFSPSEFYTILGNATTDPHMVAAGYVVDGVLFATMIESELINPVTPPTVSIDRATFDNRSNEVRLRGTVDKPTGLRVRIEFLRGAVVAGTFIENIVVDPAVGPFGEWLYRGRNTVPGGLATVTAIRLTLINEVNATVTTRTFERSAL